MKLGKRLLTIILALAISVQTGLFAVAENTDTSNLISTQELPLSSKAFSALYTMGMIGEDVASLTQNSTITRAQFIGSLYKVAGYTTAGYSASENPFIDISSKTTYKDEIAYFYSMGFINGTSQNTFSPDAPITYPQAAKVILDVCGYKEFTAKKYGNTLDGYVAMAMYIDLARDIQGISLNKPLTAAQAVELLYNAGRTKVLDATAFTTAGEAFYETFDGKELFTVRNNLYYSKGILQSNGLVSLLHFDAQGNQAVIDGETFMLDGLDITDIIGCKVEYFYKNERGTKTLAWAAACEGNETLVLTADELLKDSSSYSMTNIVYKRNKKTFNAKINRRADIIYNNELYNNAGIQKLKPVMGRITLIDYDNDMVYDTVIVEEFTNIIVEGVVNILQLISGKYGNSLYFDDYERVVVYKDGVEVDLKELAAETSVSAVISDNKKLLVLYINGPWKQSKLISLTEEGSDVFYGFESGTYQAARSYADLDPAVYYKEEMVLGATYRYYLDRNGRIADIELVSDGRLDYALLIDAGTTTRLASENIAELKLLLSNGNTVIAQTRNKMKLNGVKNKNGTDLLNYAGLHDDSGAVKVQVVRVAFDDDGKIKDFEYAIDNTAHPYGYDKSNFSLDYVKRGALSQNGTVLWWDKFQMGSYVKVFVKYTDIDLEQPYDVIDGSRLKGEALTMQLYDCDENMRPAVGYTETVAGRAITGHALVSDVFYKKHDGEMKKHLGLYYGGSYVEYPELETGIIPDDIKRGDVINTEVYKNQLTKVTLFISLKDKPAPYIDPKRTFPASMAFFGYIYSINDSCVTLLAPDSYNSSYGKLLPMPFFNNVVIPVTIYDVRNDEITRGSWEDICPSATPNVDGSLPIDEHTTMACIRSSAHSVYDIILVKY